jgi:hypothetical protein
LLVKDLYKLIGLSARYLSDLSQFFEQRGYFFERYGFRGLSNMRLESPGCPTASGLLKKPVATKCHSERSEESF